MDEQPYAPQPYAQQPYAPQQPYAQPYSGPYPQPTYPVAPRFRSNKALSTGVVALSAGLIVARLATGAAAIWVGPDAVTDQLSDQLTVPYLVWQGTSFVGQVVGLAVWIVTCLWLSVAYSNARLVEPASQPYSQPWVWLGWIVPIVSLWFPKQILDGALRVTEGAATGRYTTSVQTRTGPWWGSFLVADFLTLVATFTALSAGRTTAVVMNLLSVVALCVAMVFWVRVVGRLTSVQDRLVREGARPRDSA